MLIRMLYGSVYGIRQGVEGAALTSQPPVLEPLQGIDEKQQVKMAAAINLPRQRCEPAVLRWHKVNRRSRLAPKQGCTSEELPVVTRELRSTHRLIRSRTKTLDEGAPDCGAYGRGKEDDKFVVVPGQRPAL